MTDLNIEQDHQSTVTRCQQESTIRRFQQTAPIMKRGKNISVFGVQSNRLQSIERLQQESQQNKSAAGRQYSQDYSIERTKKAADLNKR